MFLRLLDNEGFANTQLIERVTYEPRTQDGRMTLFVHINGKKLALARNVPEEEVEATLERLLSESRMLPSA